MIYCPTLECAFQPLQKCACTSVKVALCTQLEIPIETNPIVMLLSGSHHLLTHKKITTPFWLFDNDQRYFRFTFVRNPFSRMVSCYQNKVLKNTGGVQPEIEKLKNFKDFVRAVTYIPRAEANRHFAPLTTLIGEQQFHHIGRMENIEDDWKFIKKNTKITIDLPKINVSEEVDYHKYYDEDSRRWMENYYRVDLKTFEYTY